MPTIALPNERELLIRVADGCEAAYKQLFSLYWSRIYSVALMFTKSKEMSQDLAQDVFARIWVKRENLREVAGFDAYLYIMARNLIFDRLRKQVFTSNYESNLVEYFKDTSPIPSTAAELKEIQELIHSGVLRLPKQQQRAFCLSRFQGLRHKEIAERMNISQQSVKSHIVRAIVTLKKHMGARTAQLILSLWFIAQ